MADDPLARRLQRLTPDPGRLDRAALLFAAGRASARSPRPWQALAAGLAAAQLVTLGVLFCPRWDLPLDVSEGAAQVVILEPPPREVAAPNLHTLLEQTLAAAGRPPRAAAVEALAPAEPPLRAFGTPPDALLKLLSLSQGEEP